jgi:hypothetical protein
METSESKHLSHRQIYAHSPPSTCDHGRKSGSGAAGVNTHPPALLEAEAEKSRWTQAICLELALSITVAALPRGFIAVLRERSLLPGSDERFAFEPENGAGQGIPRLRGGQHYPYNPKADFLINGPRGCRCLIVLALPRGKIEFGCLLFPFGSSLLVGSAKCFAPTTPQEIRASGGQRAEDERRAIDPDRVFLDWEQLRIRVATLTAGSWTGEGIGESWRIPPSRRRLFASY